MNIDLSNKSLTAIAELTAKSFHVKVRENKNEKFIRVSKDFDTEDEAVDFIRENKLEEKHNWVRIYNDKNLKVSGW